MGKKLLIVEDELDIQELMSFYLKKEGFEIETSSNGIDALEKIKTSNFDLIILDIMLPQKNGLDLLKEVRYKLENKVPIIIVSAKSEDSDIITGLELGADDYLTKPFNPQVLTAKVKAMARYRQQEVGKDKNEIKTKDCLIFNIEKHTCLLQGNEINLTATEFALLLLLVKEEGRVFTREQLINSIKGNDYPVTQRAIDVQIASIRKKLGLLGKNLKTVWSVGYKYQEELK